jgi:hypothetical protein
MMNEQQIAARLLELHNAYVERTGKQPKSSPKLWISSDGKATAHMWAKSYDDMMNAHGKDAKSALDLFAAQIAAIPSEAEAARIKAAKSVAQAIEDCRAAGFPDDFINPLTEMSKRISENAIAGPV